MDEQWFAEQPVEPAAEARPRVTWEDVWGGLAADRSSEGNLALAFEEIDADEWGFAVGAGTSAADRSEQADDEPAGVILDDGLGESLGDDRLGHDGLGDDGLDGWEIPALASFDAIVEQSPAHEADAGPGDDGPAGDLLGFDPDLDEPSGPLAFSTPSAPPAWRPEPDEPEPDSPPEASSPPAMDAPSVRAPVAPARVPVAAAPAPAPPARAPVVAPTSVAAEPAPATPAPVPVVRRSVEEIFADDLFDDDEDDEEPRGPAVDPFAGVAELPERWTYSSRRRLAPRGRRQGRTRPRRERGRRRARRNPFEEVGLDVAPAPSREEPAEAPSGRGPQSQGPAGRSSEDRGPAGRGRVRRRGRHRRGAVEPQAAPPPRPRRLRASIVRVLGVSVPLAAAVVAYLRLS